MIYLLENPGRLGAATTDFLPVAPHNMGDAPRCPACKRFIGMLQWRPPYKAELKAWGSSFGDIAFGPGDSLLVSERFASLWRASALVGLEGFEAVDVVKVCRQRKMSEKQPQYLHVSVMRSNVAVDRRRSGVEWGEPSVCSVCRLGNDLKGWRRIELERPATENIFFARGLPGQVIVDDRFREFCENNRIGNVRLTPGINAGHSF